MYEVWVAALPESAAIMGWIEERWKYELNATPVTGHERFVQAIENHRTDKEAHMKDDRLFLKVKLKSLAAEARIIRQLELKQLRPKLPRMPRDPKDIPTGMAIAIERARIRQLRKDWKWGNGRYLELRAHRIWVVRREARATLLAYAYIRGKPYKAVERPVWQPLSKDPEILTRAADMVMKYGNEAGRKLQRAQMVDLLDKWTKA